MKPKLSQHICFLFLLILAQSSFLTAADEGDEPEIKITTIRVEEGIYMLVGQGGNIGVCVGKDGVFIIDDQYAPLTDKILAAIAEINDGPIRFIFNTHWHHDHVGGNENLSQAGAVIVAHHNVRKRMSVDNFYEIINQSIPAFPEIALPVVTFSDDVVFHFNDMEIKAVHLPNSHTDGDAVVYFKSANVVHTGDLYFNVSGHPFIDTKTGGTIDGFINAVHQILAEIDDDTKIIPGHGSLSNKAELAAFVNRVEIIRDRVKALIAEGKNLEEIIAANPTGDFDTPEYLNWFITPKKFLTILWDDLGKEE